MKKIKQEQIKKETFFVRIVQRFNGQQTHNSCRELLRLKSNEILHWFSSWKTKQTKPTAWLLLVDKPKWNDLTVNAIVNNNFCSFIWKPNYSVINVSTPVRHNGKRILINPFFVRNSFAHCSIQSNKYAKIITRAKEGNFWIDHFIWRAQIAMKKKNKDEITSS